MYYRINVSRKEKGPDRVERYYHFFSTAETLTDRRKAMLIYAMLKSKFPVRNGYSVTVSECSVTGVDLTEEWDKTQTNMVGEE